MKTKFKMYLLLIFISISSYSWAINAPTLNSPANNSSSINTSISLICNFVDNITDFNKYTFELDTIPNFNSPAYVTTQGDYYDYGYIYKYNTGLPYGTTYYWRVKVTDGTNTSQWSDTWSFTTMEKPALYSPNNNVTGVPTSQTFYCNAEVNNTAYGNYDFEIDTTPNFNSPAHLTSQGDNYNYGQISKYYTGLLYGTTYYWRVRVHNANDTSQWSDTWSFTTMEKPSLYSPNNNATGVPTSQTLYCNAEINNTAYGNYDFEIDTTPDFNSSAHIITQGDDYNYGHISKYNTGLLYGTTYYWRVRVHNANDTSQWSDTWSFTTEYQLTNAPNLVSPANNSTDITYNNFSIQWNSIPNANTYQYQISTTINFSSIILSGNTSLTNQPITNLQPNTLYYWRVRGENNSGNSPWSQIWNFTTNQNAGIGIISDQSSVKIYPNPTNDFIIISSQKKISKCQIYNVTGEQVLQNKIDGFSKTINISELKKGVYFAKITIGENTIVKMLLKK